MRFIAICAVAVAGPLAACRGASPQNQATGTAQAASPLLLQAQESLKRAEAAPFPIPLPPPLPLPRGWKPLPAPELKPEEVEAIGLLEQATAAQPAQREAHELLARTLEPYALRAHERAVAARGKKSPPPGPPDQGVDASPARVARAYRAAIEADAGTGLIDPLLAFAGKVDDFDTMDWAHQELIRRAREKDTVGPRIRYGDFLRERRRDVLAAAELYRGALIWAPEDAVTRAKLADIYLELAKEHYAKREYAGAAARIGEAAKYVRDPASPQGVMLTDYQQRLSAIRQSR